MKSHRINRRRPDNRLRALLGFENDKSGKNDGPAMADEILVLDGATVRTTHLLVSILDSEGNYHPFWPDHVAQFLLDHEGEIGISAWRKRRFLENYVTALRTATKVRQSASRKCVKVRQEKKCDK